MFFLTIHTLGLKYFPVLLSCGILRDNYINTIDIDDI